VFQPDDRIVEAMSGVLLDVEGTTTSISFVYDVLFPFAAERLDAVCSMTGDPAVAAAIAELRREHGRESGPESGPAVPEFGDGSAYARYLMAEDRKSTGLKTLQGLIWRDGFLAGDLSGHVFADVPVALRAWKQAGVHARVFSSGSVLAQKLLFGHTDAGDLTSCFEGFHDTTTGPKREPDSYTKIARAFGLPPGRVMFLSDVVGELDAAARAGMQTALIVRPGNPPAPPSSHPSYRDFTKLAPMAP
jgi:enolase-phosphatase E1